LFAANAAPVSAQTTVASPLAFATVLRGINPHLALQQSLDYARALIDNAEKFHVDPALVLGLVTVESHWNPSAISRAGAQGLGQLEPSTARRLGVEPLSGKSNLRGTAMYLHRMLGLFHNAREPIREALAGYNAGPEAVKNFGGIPPYHETQRYVVKVLHAWHDASAKVAVSAKAIELAQATLDEITPADVDARDATYWGQ
jgi:soluble lytic murein transglycosylase-like protein